MQETGKTFDLNPKTLTLENLFALNLSDFATQIATMVSSASKEIAVEQAMKVTSETGG